MKSKLTVGLLLLFLTLLISPLYSAAAEYVPTADEAISLTGAATGFTAATMVPTSGTFKNRNADAAMVTVETASIRWRCAGTPTNTVGHLLQPGQSVFLTSSAQLQKFLAIKVSDNAAIYVTYFHRQNK